MKKLICNILSFVLATAIIFIPFDTRGALSCLALSLVDLSSSITLAFIIDIFYIITLIFFVFCILNKDKYRIYRWSCVVFVFVTFCVAYLNPRCIACLYDLKFVIAYPQYYWTSLLVLPLLPICALLPFIPYIHVARRPTKSERMQAQIDELQKQVDESKQDK